MTLGPSDRTPETQAKYQYDLDNDLLVGLHNEPPVVEHEYWKLIVNRYPYDARWRTSMLLVLKDVPLDFSIDWSGLADAPILELHKLTNQYLKVFDKAERNGSGISSVEGIPHIHLLQGLKLPNTNLNKDGE